jgi:RES domain-containing protein
VLQVRVHLDLDWDTLPDDYVLFAIDAAAIVAETIHEPPDDPRAIGDARIESQRSALLRVPSGIVPESYNVLINPTHPDALSMQLGPGHFGSTSDCGPRAEFLRTRCAD